MVTLVTGGSSGLGKATAEYFASKGGRVVLCDVSTSKGAAVAEAIGSNALYVPTDVSSENDVISLMAKTKERFGQLNVIVNCHSIASPFTSLAYNFETKEPHNLEDFQKIIVVGAPKTTTLRDSQLIYVSFQANTVGTFNVVRLGVDLLAQNEPNADGEKGVIINTVSAKTYPLVGNVANETANASTEAMTRIWAVELAPQGIRSVAIAQNNISEKSSPSTENRNGTPLDFAKLAHMIVTTPYINAATITLDGCIQPTIEPVKVSKKRVSK